MAMSVLKGFLFRPFRLLTRVYRERSGLAALEFAILGPVHLALMLGMIETGLICARIGMLEYTANRVAKFVYVGPTSGASVTQATLEQEVCDGMARFMVDCAENVTVELTPVLTLSDIPDVDVQCRDSSIEVEPNVSFNQGTSNSIVFMRICLTTDIAIPGIGMGLALDKTDSGRYQMVSSLAFVNEPF